MLLTIEKGKRGRGVWMNVYSDTIYLPRDEIRAKFKDPESHSHPQSLLSPKESFFEIRPFIFCMKIIAVQEHPAKI